MRLYNISFSDLLSITPSSSTHVIANGRMSSFFMAEHRSVSNFAEDDNEENDFSIWGAKTLHWSLFLNILSYCYFMTLSHLWINALVLPILVRSAVNVLIAKHLAALQYSMFLPKKTDHALHLFRWSFVSLVRFYNFIKYWQLLFILCNMICFIHSCYCIWESLSAPFSIW